MSLVVPVDHAQVVHQLRLAGDPEPMAITYGVKVTSPPASTTPYDMAVGLDGIWKNRLRARTNLALTMFQTEIIWQATAPPDAPVVGLYSAPVVGLETSDNIAPQNTAFLIQKRTARAGRTGQGRFYYPGVGEGYVSNVGDVSAAQVTNWNTALALMLSDIVTSGDFEYACLFHDSLGSAAAVVPTAISSLTLDPRVATQRRRLRR